MIAGIDYSTRAIDVVLLDEDSDAATWHRFELEGADALERTHDVRVSVPRGRFWDDVLAVGIEIPFGPNKNTLLPMLGALLTCIPRATLVEPFQPSRWRKTVGLPGNASKEAIALWTMERLGGRGYDEEPWPQDACDAYCIALATRSLLQHGESAPNLEVESEQAARPSKGDGPMAEPESQLSTPEIA